MPTPRVCILRAPGTNCDEETAFAFEIAGGVPQRVHVNRVLESPRTLLDYQLICVPGGFSYGDDVGAGVIFASQIRQRLRDVLVEFLQRDTLMLGICNGFQVLLKSRLLPDGVDAFTSTESAVPQATLTWNNNGKYTALWVRLGIYSPQNVFLRGLSDIELPLAHAEGQIAVRDPSVLDTLAQRKQVAVCYRPRTGEIDGFSPTDAVLPYPDNPNGSIANIAGLSDPSGRILGLMPHPERYIHATQHPQWTRRGDADGEGAGLHVFRNAVKYLS